MESEEIDKILTGVKHTGSNATIEWIAQNEDGAWDEEFLAVMQVLGEYRKRCRGVQWRRHADVYHAMKLMGYSRSKYLPSARDLAPDTVRDDAERQNRLLQERRRKNGRAPKRGNGTSSGVTDSST